MDIVFLGLVLAFAAAIAGMVIGCDALRRPGEKSS
jgi:hypothetical protein